MSLRLLTTAVVRIENGLTSPSVTSELISANSLPSTSNTAVLETYLPSTSLNITIVVSVFPLTIFSDANAHSVTMPFETVSGKAHPRESKRLGYKILSLEAVTGYPHDPAGLCGYNCKHTFYPFIAGISEPTPLEKEPAPVVVDGKTYTRYQATQHQRRMERELREFKRQHIGGQNRTAAINAKEQQYARFCEKAGLKQNLNRLYVKGYKRDFEYLKSTNVLDHAEAKVLAHGKKHGTEALIWLDKNGNEILPFKTGGQSSVAISAEEIKYLKSLNEGSIISLHNHPKSSSFSPEDMNIMCRLPSVETMRVIGHDGTRYVLSVGSGERPDLDTIWSVYNSAGTELAPKFRKEYEKIVDSQKVWKEHSHEIVEKVAERFGWNYERI